MSIKSMAIVVAALVFTPGVSASPLFIGTLPELLWPIITGAFLLGVLLHLKRMSTLADQRSQRMEELLSRVVTLMEEKSDKYLDLMEKPAVPAAKPRPLAAPAPVAAPARVTKPAPAPAQAAAPTPSAPAAPVAAGLQGVDQGIALIEAREASFPGNLNQAIEILEGELNGSDKGRAHTYLSEANFWLADYSESDADKKKYHAIGVEHGKQAVALDADNVASHLWYAANMGSHALVVGISSSMFYLNPIDKHGNLALEMDEDFFHGAPLRLMGVFYRDSPPWPVGKCDRNKAVALLERAVKSGPEFLLNHLYLAETLIVKRKKREAKKLIEDVLGRSNIQEFPLYQKQVQDKARALLKQV